jgi:PKD repeat protein
MPRRPPLPLAIATTAALCSLITLTVAPGHAASVQLSWQAPTTDADGSPLTDLAGYKVYYGLRSAHYDVTLDVGNALSVAISGLIDGLTYYVAVTAYDTSGNESAFSNEVSMQPSAPGPLPPSPLPQPVADFSATSTDGANPLTVDFMDASSGSITTWAWDFGDGGTSTAQHPSHHYAQVGTYTVSLTVSGPGGSDTQIKTDYIAVTEK